MWTKTRLRLCEVLPVKNYNFHRFLKICETFANLLTINLRGDIIICETFANWRRLYAKIHDQAKKSPAFLFIGSRGRGAFCASDSSNAQRRGNKHQRGVPKFIRARAGGQNPQGFQKRKPRGVLSVHRLHCLQELPASFVWKMRKDRCWKSIASQATRSIHRISTVRRRPLNWVKCSVDFTSSRLASSLARFTCTKKTPLTEKGLIHSS